MNEIKDLIELLAFVRGQVRWYSDRLGSLPEAWADGYARFQNAEYWIGEIINAHPDTLQLS